MPERVNDILYRSASENVECNYHNYAYTFLEWDAARYRKSWEDKDYWLATLSDLLKRPTTELPKKFVSWKDKPKEWEQSIKDHRLLAVAIQGLKVFPYVTADNENVNNEEEKKKTEEVEEIERKEEKKQKKEEPSQAGYGILFCRNHKDIKSQPFRISSSAPLSSIIYGANGTGKTSIFSALELGGMGYSYLAAFHGNKGIENQVNKLLHYGDGKDQLHSTPSIRLFTKDKIYSFDYVNLSSQLHIPQAFFCSQYDYSYLTSHSNYEIDLEYICQQVGISALYKFKRFIDYLYEALNRLKQIQSPKNTIIGEASPNSKDKKEEEKKVIKNFTETYNITPEEVPKSSYVEGLIEVEDIRRRCMETINKVIKETATIANNLISVIMKEFDEFHTDEIEIRAEEVTEGLSKGYYRLVPVIKIGDKTAEPKDYYNTFRYNLFFICLKITLACTAQRMHRINFPIIFDDMFNGTDFENRYRIGIFIEKVLDNYKHQEDADKYPLQLILFTQDKLIAEGFFNRLNNEAEALFLRLHHPIQCVKEDTITIETTDKKEYSLRLVATKY